MRHSIKLLFGIFSVGILILASILLFQKMSPKNASSENIPAPSSAKTVSQDNPAPPSDDTSEKPSLAYTNDEFGFSLDLPDSFMGYKAEITRYGKDNPYPFGSGFCGDDRFTYCIADINIVIPTDKPEEYVTFWNGKSNQNKMSSTLDGYKMTGINVSVIDAQKWESMKKNKYCSGDMEKGEILDHCPQYQMESFIDQNEKYVYLFAYTSEFSTQELKSIFHAIQPR